MSVTPNGGQTRINKKLDELPDELLETDMEFEVSEQELVEMMAYRVANRKVESILESLSIGAVLTTGIRSNKHNKWVNICINDIENGTSVTSVIQAVLQNIPESITVEIVVDGEVYSEVVDIMVDKNTVDIVDTETSSSTLSSK